MLANTNLILHDITTPSIRFGDSLQRPLTEYTRKDRVDAILANPPFGGVVSNNNENNFPQTYRTKESADLFLILMIHLLKDCGRAAIVLPDGSLTGDGVKQRIRQKVLEDCNLHTIVRLPNSVFQPYASVATNLLFFTKGEPTETIWYYEHKLPEGYKAYSKTKTIQLAEFDNLKAWWPNREASEQAWQVDIDTIKANGYNLDIKNPHRPEEEKPFELPEGWEWCRLEEAGLFERGKSKHRPRNDPRLFEEGHYPFVQTGDVARSKNNGFKIKSFSQRYNDFGLAQSRKWSKGTLCITIAANIAETGFLD